MFCRSWLIAAFLSLASAAWAQSPPAAIVYPPGQYLVSTPAPTTIAWTATSVTFSWTLATPAPVPPAPPAPSPAPTPIPPAPPASPHVPRIVGHIWVVRLSDGSAPATANSPDLVKSLAPLDASYFSWTRFTPDAAPWLVNPEVRASQYNCVLLITANGAGDAVLSYATKLPVTDADIVSLVTSARAKGGH